MAGLKFGSFSQAARVSNLDIDMDLDMGTRAVIAAKGRFAEAVIGTARFNDIARFGETVFEDTMIIPYTVTPSNNVYYTSDISQTLQPVEEKQLNGSIVIGPTSHPISPRLYFNATTTGSGAYWEVRVYKNGEFVGTIGPISGPITDATINLTDLNGGDVLTFIARTISSGVTYSVTFSNFRLAGDVVKYVLDGPTAETVYD